MSRSPFSLKSAHLLMWSSPLLLLVLVFTLTASSPSAPEVSLRPPSSTSPATTLIPNTTTTTSTTKTSTPVIVTAKITTSTLSVATSFSNVTTSSAKPAAPIANGNAMSGALSGTLEPGIESVDVPLLGPGDWTLTASATTNQTL